MALEGGDVEEARTDPSTTITMGRPAGEEGSQSARGAHEQRDDGFCTLRTGREMIGAGETRDVGVFERGALVGGDGGGEGGRGRRRGGLGGSRCGRRGLDHVAEGGEGGARQGL